MNNNKDNNDQDNDKNNRKGINKQLQMKKKKYSTKSVTFQKSS